MAELILKALPIMAMLLLLGQPGALFGDAHGQSPVAASAVAEPLPAGEGDRFIGRPEDYVEPQARRQIIIGPPISRFDSRGEIFVQPNISIADATSDFEPIHVGGPDFGHGALEPESLRPPEAVLTAPEQPFDALPSPYGPSPVAQPMFDEFVGGIEQIVPSSRRRRSGGPLCRLWQRLNDPYGDMGIGYERVMFALFEMDVSQPLNRFRVRLDSAWDVEFPDRSEYMWAKITGRGPPKADSSVNYQQLGFLHEIGGETFSVQTEIPIRAFDPVVNHRAGGMGDMTLTTKTVIVNGETWQITQLFRTILPTGSAKRGTGRGSVAMEAGFCGHYKWTDATYLHGEIIYWFPVGADPIHAGTVLKYGIGASHLLLDTDKFAVIPTMEFVYWNFLAGQKTPPSLPAVATVNDFVFNVHPGLRVVWDNNSDLGLWEFGIAGGFQCSRRHFYSGLLRIEMQYSW